MAMRSPAVRIAWLLAALLAFVAFIALGTWQIQRRAWKLDLIERVNTRLHAPPVDAPGPSAWPQITAQADEYRRVRLVGRFMPGRDTLVRASTRLGPGFWVMSPLKLEAGGLVLVNRGFVPEGPPRPAPPLPDTPVTITGLLRLSEPAGHFPRCNEPAQHRWFAREVPAIAQAQGLTGLVAPYFVDADASGGLDAVQQPGGPIGGLTVIQFPNNHLVYALTWYGLALMVGLGAAYAAWDHRQSHTPADHPG